MRNSLPITTSGGRFVFESGIVAVPGDDDQFVKSLIRRIKDSPLKEREHMDRSRGNDAGRLEVAFSAGLAFNSEDLY